MRTASKSLRPAVAITGDFPEALDTLLQAFDRSGVPWSAAQSRDPSRAANEEADMVIPVRAAPRAMKLLERHRFMQVATRNVGRETSYATYDRGSARWLRLRITWEGPSSKALGAAPVPQRAGLLDLALSGSGGAVSNAFHRHRRGFTLALLGPDGAGKSTIAAQIAASFPFPARMLYMGLWQRPEQPGHSAWLPGWSLVTRLLMEWRVYLLGRYYRARGYLVIFDRYCYDAFVPPIGKRSARARLYAWILGHGCPAPDLTVLLDAPGELMHERKRESNPIDLERQRQGFLSLRKRLPHLLVVDAAREEQTLRAEMIDLIWSRYFGRG